MYNYNHDVEVIVNNKPIRKFAHNGKIFVEARSGNEYSIKIKNNVWSRKLVICSVDGINVLDGKAAGSTKMGYIVQGNSSIEVKGFRVSNDAVNAFKFNKKEESYAAHSDETQGDTSNCGVIGIEIYAEKEKTQPEIRIIEKIVEKPIYIRPWNEPQPWRYYPTTIWCSTTSTSSSELNSQKDISCYLGQSDAALRSADNNSLGSSPSINFMSTASYSSCESKITQDSFDMGTEFSDKEIQDKIEEVEFSTGKLETSFAIYYASREALIKMGVQVEREVQIASFPSPFPNKFCKPPQKKKPLISDK